MNRLGIVKVGSDGQLKITQASKMKVQPHSSNLQLTHKANRSWIGDWGQGIRKEKPFLQCHQHISSSSILEALSSRRSDVCSRLVRKSFLGTGRLFETDYWIWTLLSPLDCNKGVWQPFVAASSWNMSYAALLSPFDCNNKGSKVLSQQMFQLGGVHQVIAGCWLKHLDGLFQHTTKNQICCKEQWLQARKANTEKFNWGPSHGIMSSSYWGHVFGSEKINTCNNCMFLCLLSLAIQ